MCSDEHNAYCSGLQPYSVWLGDLICASPRVCGVFNRLYTDDLRCGIVGSVDSNGVLNDLVGDALRMFLL